MAVVVQRKLPRKLRGLAAPEDNVENKRSRNDCDKKFRSKLLTLGKDVSCVNCI
jgi:hypothetical protein